MRIVDVLETIEIDGEHDDARGVVDAAGEQFGQALRNTAAVRKPRQRIVKREVPVALGRLLRRLQVDHIGRRCHSHDQRDACDDAAKQEWV